MRCFCKIKAEQDSRLAMQDARLVGPSFPIPLQWPYKFATDFPSLFRMYGLRWNSRLDLWQHSLYHTLYTNLNMFFLLIIIIIIIIIL